jgi:hypothetical protein
MPAQFYRGNKTKMYLLQTVTDVTLGRARVKYVVTEAGNLVVNGVLASVFSTPAGFWETLPFRILDSFFKVRFYSPRLPPS